MELQRQFRCCRVLLDTLHRNSHRPCCSSSDEENELLLGHHHGRNLGVSDSSPSILNQCCGGRLHHRDGRTLRHHHVHLPVNTLCEACADKVLGLDLMSLELLEQRINKVLVLPQYPNYLCWSRLSGSTPSTTWFLLAWYISSRLARRCGKSVHRFCPSYSFRWISSRS